MSMRMAIPSSMNAPMATALHEPISVLRRVFFSDIRCLSGLTWKRVGLTFALCLALGMNSAPRAVLGNYGHLDAALDEYLSEAFCWCVNHLLFFGVLLVLATIADNLPLHRAARGAAFAAALALALYAFMPLECLFGPFTCIGFPSWAYFNPLRILIDPTTLAFIPLAVVVGAVYENYRRGESLAERLYAATMQRLDVQRRTARARLQVTQARIEPAFLLDTLSEVSARCDDDSAGAERVIDGLVRYLRATLPSADEHDSTLDRELRVARSFLDVVSMRRGGHVQVAIEAPDALVTQPFAPALLMPLVARIVGGMAPRIRAGRIGQRHTSIDGEPVDLRVDVSASAEHLRLSIVASGSSMVLASDDRSIADIRARLDDLYGAGRASVVVGGSGTQASAVLVVPRERAFEGGRPEPRAALAMEGRPMR